MGGSKDEHMIEGKESNLWDVIYAPKKYVYAFFYLDPLQNQAILTSQCMHNIFFQGREEKHSDQSVLPVTKNRERERGNGPSALGWKMDAQTFV